MSGKPQPGAPLQVWRIKEDPHSAALDDAWGKGAGTTSCGTSRGPVGGVGLYRDRTGDDLVIVVKGGKGEPATPSSSGKRLAALTAGVRIESKCGDLTAVDAENDEALEGGGKRSSRACWNPTW